MLMSFKDFYRYEPKNEYNFSLEPPSSLDNTNLENQYYQDITEKVDVKISTNLEFMQTEYNTMINNDIQLREFSLWAKNKQYKAFVFYIDGMVDTQLVNDFILKPLMIRNKSNIFDGEITEEESNNKFVVKKVKDFDLIDYIFSTLMPQNNLKKSTELSEIISGVNSGNCALFVDTINTAFDIDVKGFQQRNIDTPKNEAVIKGPQEAFVENIRTNTSLLRRFSNNQNLIIESISIGNISKTSCALCYMKNIANGDLVAEAKYRLNNLDIDTLLSSGQLEQLIQDSHNFGIPQIISTERPDKCVKGLMQGRCVILINGNPYALIIPSVMTDFVSSPEDGNLNPMFANFLKILRFFALLISLFLPGIYIAITGFHQEILPTELLFSIFSSRENVPFPVIVELLVMEISFELIRESSLRVPSPIGATVGIVGALILGDAAVSANIVSPFLIIIVSLTGISSFAIPDYSFQFHLRVYRFAFILLGYVAGFLGIGIGLYIYVSILCSMKSFGVSYTSPISPDSYDIGVKYFLPPFWKIEHRPYFLNSKKKISQDKISRKWRN